MNYDKENGGATMSEPLLQKINDLIKRKNALASELESVDEEIRISIEAYRQEATADPNILDHWNVELEGPISTEETEPKLFEREKIYD
jgi:hypothetical protein